MCVFSNLKFTHCPGATPLTPFERSDDVGKAVLMGQSVCPCLCLLHGRAPLCSHPNGRMGQEGRKQVTKREQRSERVPPNNKSCSQESNEAEKRQILREGKGGMRG